MTTKTRRTLDLIDALAGKTSLYSQPSIVVPRKAFDLMERAQARCSYGNRRVNRYDCGLVFRLR